MASEGAGRNMAQKDLEKAVRESGKNSKRAGRASESPKDLKRSWAPPGCF